MKKALGTSSRTLFPNSYPEFLEFTSVNYSSDRVLIREQLVVQYSLRFPEPRVEEPS